jgi:hypothetical protein
VSLAHTLREVLLELLQSVAYRLAPPVFYECWHLAHAIVGQALGLASKRPVATYFTQGFSCLHAVISHV